MMTNSPWARFFTFITPHTRARPQAASTKIAPMKRPSSASCTLRAGASVSRSILSNIGVLRPIYPAGGGARLPPPGSGRGQHKGETSVHRLAWPLQLMRSVLRRRHHVVLAALDLPQHHRLGDVVAGLRELDRAVEGLHLERRKGVAHRFGVRSEEHTSELQSLMRSSYAVFCLKKKQLTY